VEFLPDSGHAVPSESGETIGAEFAAILWSEGLFRHFDIDAKSLLMRA
jgi:hypothetical protein